MRIRLLGPLDIVTDDGERVDIGAPMLRALLSALALRRGQVVSVDELAGQLWGEAPPKSVRTTLRNYVMRLRRLLPPDCIRTQAGGYQLAVLAENTDLDLFRSLLERSGSTPSAEQSLHLLDQALELWRGEPLGDIGDCPLRAEQAPRLTELRLAAVEERFEVKNRLGHHAEVIDELYPLVRKHGLRERLVRQLMLALHHNARTADALLLYQSVSARLGDELGLEPGSELQELHRTIQAGSGSETGRAGEAGGAGTAVRTVPRTMAEFPHRAANTPPEATLRSTFSAAQTAPSHPFVGRDRERTLLHARLTGAGAVPVVCLIDGPAGVGKSALAHRAAHDAAHHHPDGTYHLDLHGADPHTSPRSPDTAVRELLTTLGMPPREIPADPAAAAVLYHKQLGNRRALLVLDNALDAEQITPLLPSGNTSVLITSRAVLPLPVDGQHLHLGRLSTEDAVHLLTAVRATTIDAGTAPDPPDGTSKGTLHGAHASEMDVTGSWTELAGLCDHLPLALHILGLRMAARPQWNSAHWCTALRRSDGVMNQLRAGTLDLYASLMASTDELARSNREEDRQAAQLFRWLGIGGMRTHTSQSLAALADCSETTAEQALERLTDARVTDSPRPGVYVLPRLMRAAAVRSATRLPADSTHRGLLRLADWYLGTLYRMNQQLPVHGPHRLRMDRGIAHHTRGRSFTGPEDALNWADDAVEQTLVLARKLTDPAYDEEPLLADGRPASAFCLDAAIALGPYYALRPDRTHQEQLSVLVQRTAARHGDRFAEAVAAGELGQVRRHRESADRVLPLLERAVELFASLGDQASVAVAVSDIVACLSADARPAEAVQRGEATLPKARASGDTDAVVRLLSHLAIGYLQRGGLTASRAAALESYRLAAFPYQQSNSAAILAVNHQERGEYEEAARWAELGLTHTLEQPCDPSTVSWLRSLLSSSLDRTGSAFDPQTAHARQRVAIKDQRAQHTPGTESARTVDGEDQDPAIRR